MRDVLVVILAGGKGERLYPLTRDRAKPAVPFGGIYRIIDLTLSNCVNANLRKVHIFTQYKSNSLISHIQRAWSLFRREFDEYLTVTPAQQMIDEQWYRGTADAIYQNIYFIQGARPDLVVILSGDHIYRMDYNFMIDLHVEKKADLTVGCVEVARDKATSLGVIEQNEEGRIVGFEEKPRDPKPSPHNSDVALASMGIYVFNTEVLVRKVIEDAKLDSHHDFGRDIIPSMIGTNRVFAYNFRNPRTGKPEYWKDIGAVDAFYDAHMDLVGDEPKFDLYDPQWPIWTRQGPHPPARTVFGDETLKGRMGIVLGSLISQGTIVRGGRVYNSVLSPQVRVETDAEVKDSVLMEGVEIGCGARVRRTIIDKFVKIPAGMHIGYDQEADTKLFTVSDSGVVVAQKEIRLE